MTALNIRIVSKPLLHQELPPDPRSISGVENIPSRLIDGYVGGLAGCDRARGPAAISRDDYSRWVPRPPLVRTAPLGWRVRVRGEVLQSDPTALRQRLPGSTTRTSQC